MGGRAPIRVFTIVALAVAVGLAVAISPFASGSPDGLEKVAEDKAFLDEGQLASIQESSPVPDYAFPGVENERVATGIAGFLGTLGTFAIGYGIAFGLARRPRAGTEPRGPTAAAG